MHRLKPEDLAVTSFDTAPLEDRVVTVGGESGDVNCDSPLCGPTYWKTCECDGNA